MKKLLLVISLLAGLTVHAQSGVSINEDGTNADGSAMLEVKSSNKGFLPPRMTSSEIMLIPNPAEGLTVYNLSTHKPMFFDGTAWQYYDGTLNPMVGMYYQGGIIIYLFQSGNLGFVEGEIAEMCRKKNLINQTLSDLGILNTL